MRSGRELEEFTFKGAPLTKNVLDEMKDAAYGVWGQNLLDYVVSMLEQRKWGKAKAALDCFDDARRISQKLVEYFTVDGQPLTGDRLRELIQEASRTDNEK
jgi:hypothetical protein